MRVTVAAALLAAAVASLDPGGLLEGFERRTLDARHRAFGEPSAMSGRIVILAISEESLERLRPAYGRWPWPRSLHGEVVEYLAADGAAAIGFDLLFAEPQSRREAGEAEWEALAALARQADLPDVRRELVRRLDSRDPGAADRPFVDSVSRAGMVFSAVVLASVPGMGHTHDTPASSDADKAPGEAILPFPDLANASRGVGHINAVPDADGVYRRFAPMGSLDGAAYPSLGVAVAAHVKGVPLDTIRPRAGGLAFGEATLPLLRDGTAWIRYQGGAMRPRADGSGDFESYYRFIRYEDVLAARDLGAGSPGSPLAPGAFRDKIVLVSAQAAGLSDLRATPFSPVTPGVEIHANVIDNLLAGRFLRQPGDAARFAFTLLVCAAMAALARAPRLATAVPLAAGAIASVAGGAWIAFGRGWIVPIVEPVVAMAFAYAGALLARAATAERERRWLRDAFGHYLAPAVLEELLRSPEKLRLGGERRRVTVLFSDVAGFTALSEKLAPEAVGALLNGYLGRMTACVARSGGTVDKFVGDAVMAEWNAPIAQPDHAARACEAALAMLDEVAREGAAWRAAGASLDIRIGINTGEAIVGNMGSPTVFDYTAIGNEVNTAARLEPLNKEFGTRIIVSGMTRGEAEAHRPGRFAFRPLARVVAKGRAEPIDIHELAGWRDRLDEAALASHRLFEAAMERYLARRFEEARALFVAVLESAPGDGPATLFASLCATWLAEPPPPEWSGALAQSGK